MAKSESESFAKGEVIFQEGDRADCAYLIMSGEVDILVKRLDQDVKINTVSKDQLLGEMALVDDSPRSATAIAATDVEAAVVTAEAFRFWLDTLNPFLQRYVTYLIGRVRDLTNRVES